MRKSHAGLSTAVASGVIAAVVGLSSCGSGQPQSDDLQNVPPSYPNYAAIIMSPDGYPNYVMSCFLGAGFALTTRDAAGAITRVPEWDAFCEAQKGKQATQNGQP